MAVSEKPLLRRVKQVREKEIVTFVERTKMSEQLYRRACKFLPLGVPTTFQQNSPYPLYFKWGRGPWIGDVDGNTYIDYHAGSGALAVGHAHPAIVSALNETISHGAHFGAGNEIMLQYVEELCRRFNLDRVRLSGSGTEATMGAIRVARAVTGRSRIIKMRGQYHGHHDGLLFSVGSTSDKDLQEEESFGVARASRGMPDELDDLICLVEYNNPEELSTTLASQGETIAAVIMEPIMTNVGIVRPLDGYLEKVRQLCDEYGLLLIFDEVKTGATVAPGGASELLGVTPDLICLGKTICGGLPGGAFGGAERFMSEIENGVFHAGTFNGNPVTSAAGHVALTEVLTPQAYDVFARQGRSLAHGLRDILNQHELKAEIESLGCKGAVTFRSGKHFTSIDSLLQEVLWLLLVNRDMLTSPHHHGEWLFSTQHNNDDIERFLDVFNEACSEITR